MSDVESLESAPLLPTDPSPNSMVHNVSFASGLKSGLASGGLVWVAQFGAIGSVLILWKILLTHPAGLFTKHPALQSLAILLFTEGVLVLQPTRTAGAKKTGLQLHQLFQGTALPLLIAGSSYIWYNKAIHNAPHITTWHATFGVITFTLLILQIIAGALVVYAPGLFGGEARAKALWKFHRIGGYTTLAGVFLTPALAIGWSDWVVGNSTRLERGLMLAGLGLSAVGVASRISGQKLGLKR